MSAHAYTGIPEAMRYESLKVTPRAMLSRLRREYGAVLL
jgi:molybdopterin biosynthesis enzyme MoaB